MPISFYSPPALTPEQSGAIPDILGNILSGYEGVSKARYLQPGLQEALRQTQLVNQKVGLENKYYPELSQSEINLRKAQTEAAPWGNTKQGQLLRLLSDPRARAAYNQMVSQEFGGNMGQENGTADQQNQPQQAPANQLNPIIQKMLGGVSGLSGIPGISEISKYLQQIVPQQTQPQELAMQQQANIMTPQKSTARRPSFEEFIANAFADEDKQYAPTDLAKTANEMRTINAGFYPGTQIPIKDPDEQRMLKEAYGSKLAHMRAGETLVYDETGTKPIGERVHYTPLEREREVGRNFYDLLTPVINNGVSGLKGKDSIKLYLGYVNNYSKDPVAKKKIDDLLLAQKLLTPAIVSEMATLATGKQKIMFQNLQKAFPGIDIPNILTSVVNQLQLPSEAFDLANERSTQFISEKRREAADSVPATHIRYFNPQVSKEIQKEMTQEEGEEEYTEKDIEHTLKLHPEYSREQVIKLMGI